MTNNNLSKNSENFSSLKLDWKIIQKDMKNMFGEDIYESWLKKINFEEEFQNYILLSVSTRFIRDWIASRYLDQILQIVKNYKKKINRKEFRIKENN
jgi:chromosomal replication initiator protein